MWLDGPDMGCPSCSSFVDQIGHLAHLNARDTTFAAVSRGQYASIERFKQRMGWTFPRYSSAGSDFNYDFHVTFDESVMPLEYNDFLDLTPLGRQEEWEEPKGRATALGAPAGGVCVRYHDEYDT